jgi:hypothetical protein
LISGDIGAADSCGARIFPVTFLLDGAVRHHTFGDITDFTPGIDILGDIGPLLVEAGERKGQVIGYCFLKH